MSIPALDTTASIPTASISVKREGKISDKKVTAILIFGGTTATVMLIASAILLQFSLLIAGFAMLGFTALAAIYVYRNNLRALTREFYTETTELQEEINELKEEVNELKAVPKETPFDPAAILGRIAVLEKEFLNRGRYKYIDETPGPDDVPLPSTGSPAMSSTDLPK